jgi:hypothetical protein
MNKSMALALLALPLAGSGSRAVADEARTLKTIVDASAGVTRIALGSAADTAGAVVVFDQPLLDESGKTIGSNSGFCIRTGPEFSECHWTLALTDGSITVAGREAAIGTSSIPIIGGTGAYAGASGVMTSVPSANQIYTQMLTYSVSPR